jgi:hypothetical protein
MAFTPMPDRNKKTPYASLNASLRQEAEDVYCQLERQILADKMRLHKEEQRRCTEIAKQRCANMKIPLTQEEEELVQIALNAEGELYVRGLIGGRQMHQVSLVTLKDGTWINDDICTYMLKLLLEREEVMCIGNPTKKRSFWFEPFFFTKLTTDGDGTANGGYNFTGVDKWSEKIVPDGDIFSLDKLFVPINQTKSHWLVVVVFFEQKRIQVFDSLFEENGVEESQVVFKYIQHQHWLKHGIELPQKKEWVIITNSKGKPRQENGELLNKCIHSIDISASHTRYFELAAWDCGLFMILTCDFLSLNLPLIFEQSDVAHYRKHTVLSILLHQLKV